MNWKKILFIGGIGAGLYYLLNKVSSNVLVNFSGLKWLGLDGIKLRWALKYDLENRNDIPVTVTEFKGRLYFGSYRLNDVLITDAVTVPPGGQERIEVQFSMSPGTVLAEILQFIERRDGLKRFRLKGTMTGKLGNVPWIYPLNETLSLANE